jgi:transcriptional regulator with XRE-family HTH domain
MKPPVELDVEEALRRFRARMKDLREQRAWSKAECARHAGLDQSEWSRIERGITAPSLQSALRIHYALQLDSMDALFGELPATEILSGQMRKGGAQQK